MLLKSASRFSVIFSKAQENFIRSLKSFMAVF